MIYFIASGESELTIFLAFGMPCRYVHNIFYPNKLRINFCKGQGQDQITELEVPQKDGSGGP